MQPPVFLACGSRRRPCARRLVGWAAVALSAACRAEPPRRYAFERPAMGTEFRLLLYAPDEGRAERAAEAAFARIRELDRTLSDYDPDSELSRLGRSSDAGPSGAPLAVGPDLWRVLLAGQEVARASGGAFDLTVGPYVRLWRRARRQGQLPDSGRLARAAAAVGYEKVECVESGQVRLLATEMRLDAGGIAKGYALDQALEVLRAHGIERALLDGGGDLLAARPPPGCSGWQVRLVGLSGADERLELANAALATSGDLERFFEFDGRRWSHVVDPRTGWAVSERRLVSVLAPTAMEADAWATALSVSGVEGLSCFQVGPGRGARLVVRREGQSGDPVFRSGDFPASLSLAPPLESP